MNRAVLDASALLALLFKEPGGEKVVARLPGSMLSAVNLSEVVAKAVDLGMTLEESRTVTAGLPCRVVPFDGEQAYLAGALRPATRTFGFSLGDRACLALGLKSGCPVVTADRRWGECDVGVEIIHVR